MSFITPGKRKQQSNEGGKQVRRRGGEEGEIHREKGKERGREGEAKRKKEMQGRREREREEELSQYNTDII